jgi:S1-C subfamily serine protease
VPRRNDFAIIERTTTEVFKQASPSVVSVANKTLVQDFFGFQVYEVPQGTGSGFIWDKQGHIISNLHVVYGASAIRVTLRNGSVFDATVVGADPDHDIAVLKIAAPAEALVPLQVGTSRDLEVGQWVMAIGNPYGLDTSLSVGVVSALGRTITSMTDRQIFDVIQTDAAINPGNSGGPLLDFSGRLIGINTAIVSPSGGYAGVGFAVPVDTVRRIVPQLIAHGKVRRAGFGVRVLPDHVAQQAGVEGVAILSVEPRSAAARAGLEGVRRTLSGNFALGDVIVKVDALPVRNNDDLVAVLDRHEVGDAVDVTLVRGGQRRAARMVLQAVD